MSAPRQWVHRGRIRAGAVVIERSVLGEAEARRRVCALWTSGVEVRELGRDWLVVFPEARRLWTGGAPGLPLVAAQGSWEALPLDEPARTRAMVRPGEVALAVEGVVLSRSPGAAVEPASWLDLSDFPEVPMRPLAKPPPAVEEVAAVGPNPADYGIRELGDEAEALLLALRDGTESGRPWWVAPLQTVLSWLPAGGTATGRAATGEGRSAPATGQPEAAAPTWFERLLGRLRLDLVFGPRASRLVQDLLDQLDGDDLEAALRRAIPLGGAASGEGGFSIPWGLPFRDRLSVSAPVGGGGGIGIGENLYGLLRQAYERAAERLERAGQIEQAAYVLAELLDRAADAVALCERHERYALAARIAEVRRLSPEVGIRLWILAGEVDRAMDLAMLTEAYAAALFQLEGTHPDRARLIRMKWGIALAEAGRYAAAVDLLEPLSTPPARFVFEIAQKGIEAGGPAAGELAVRRLSWGPESELEAHVMALLRDDGELRGDERLGALRQLSQRDAPVALHRLAVRTWFREQAATGALEASVRQGLLLRAQDPVLRADLPTEALPEPTRLHDRTHPLEIDIEAGGGAAVLSVIALPDGGLALALGDAGLRVLDGLGRVRAHHDIPARALVPSRDRTRLLVLERPSGPGRVWRVDPFEGPPTPWGQLDLHRYAPEYDGMLWAVGTEGRIRLLDTRSDRPRSLWSVPVEGVSAIRAAPEFLYALAEDTKWSWRTREREPRLTDRTELTAPRMPHAVGEHGGLAWIDFGERPVLKVGGRPGLAAVERELEADGAEGFDLEPCGQHWLVRGLVWEPDMRTSGLRLFQQRGRLQEVLRVRASADLTAVDPTEHRLVVGTSDGQVLSVDLRTGRRRWRRVT